MRWVTGHLAALAERKGLSVETLPPDSEGKARHEAALLEDKRVLLVLHEREAIGKLDVFYLDESDFSSRSYVSYAWQHKSEAWRFPAKVPGRTKVIDFLGRNHEAYYFIRGWFRYPSKDHRNHGRIHPLAQP